MLDNLTPREKEVIHLIAQGLSNNEIADKMTITVKTIYKYISGMLHKCNANNRTHLAVKYVRWACANGISECCDG